MTTALRITYVRTIRLLPMLVIACVSVALFSPGIAPLASCKWLSLWTGPLFVSNSVVPADRQCLPWLWPLQPLAMAHFIVPLVPVAAYRLARSRMLNFKPACTLLLATLLVLTEVRLLHVVLPCTAGCGHGSTPLVCFQAPNLFFSSSDIPQLDLWELGPVLSWPHTRFAWFLRLAPCLAGALAATSVYCPTTLGRADLRLAYKWQSRTSWRRVQSCGWLRVVSAHAVRVRCCDSHAEHGVGGYDYCDRGCGRRRLACPVCSHQVPQLVLGRPSVRELCVACRWFVRQPPSRLRSEPGSCLPVHYQRRLH